jgi:ubiquitin-conjugating enzyme E2 Q
VGGTKRVLMEFQHLARAVASGTAPCFDLELPDERDVRVWRFKLADFDGDTAGGRALNGDLARLQREHGAGHLQCELLFPADYPSRPFLLRLVYPRCCWYTGHVTAGGSVCMEALTQTGSANSWRPDYCVSGLLPLVKHNMIDVEEVMVRTASGPGGRAGPLRVDFERRWHPTPSPLVPYSQAEAQAAFARTEAHHRANGW